MQVTTPNTNRSPLPFTADSLSEAIRNQVREAVAGIAGEQLTVSIAAKAYPRTPGRLGYRNGSKPRSLTTSSGRADI